jgi:hypothetical protein
LNDELRIADFEFLVDMTGHLNSQNKELEDKVKLITGMPDTINMFKVKFQLWKI